MAQKSTTMKRKRAIITGATGMVGGIVLKACLNNAAISEVTSISRRSVGFEHPKLKEVIHADFENFAGLEEHFQNQDVAYFCIGVYTGAVKDDLFKKISVDYTLAFSKFLKQHSPKINFCFLSGAGADQSEKSRVSFAKYKGMAENSLQKIDFDALYIFRPAYIYPVKKRKEPNAMYRFSRMLYPLLKNIYSKGVITSEELGNAIFKVGISGAEKSVLENQDIKQIK